MADLVVASTRKSAGKTGIILGLSAALGKPAAYIKPLGDRLLYRKKRLWDYDAAVVLAALGSNTAAEDLTIGFERAKLRYMYDEARIAQRLRDLAAAAGAGKEVLFVEGGADLAHGTSVHLDPISVARTLSARLLLVAAGGDDTIVDDLACFRRCHDCSGVDLAGVIANRLADPGDFRSTAGREMEALGIPLLGAIPHVPELQRVSVRFLAECLFARIITGERNLDRQVHHVFVGAMSADAALRNHNFQKENKLIITSGDRSDMILASLETSTAGLVLANNILPPANIVSKAAERGVPMLLVAADTFLAAKQVDDLEPLVTREDSDKMALLARLVAKHVDVDRVLK